MYPYDYTMRPPCPRAPLRITNPLTSMVENTTGILDTGASVTVIPQSLEARLRLTRQGSGTIVGIGGSRMEVAVYVAHLTVAEITVGSSVVFALDQPNILLGRDLLNQFNIFLRGKAQTFDMAAA